MSTMSTDCQLQDFNAADYDNGERALKRAASVAVGGALAGAGLAGSALTMSEPACAGPLEDLQTGISTIDGVWTTAAGIAVGIIAFVAGARIVKRAISQ